VKLSQYPDYEIYSDGRIWSYITKKYLKPALGAGRRSKRYLTLCLKGKNRKGTCYVHRLVAMCFVSGFKRGLTVNHKDGNKLNNRHTNLEWVTYAENNQHAWDIGLKKGKKERS